MLRVLVYNISPFSQREAECWIADNREHGYQLAKEALRDAPDSCTTRVAYVSGPDSFWLVPTHTAVSYGRLASIIADKTACKFALR